MPYSIIQQTSFVGTHNKQLVKTLIAVPSKWFDYGNGVLFWPPAGTKPTTITTFLKDGDSAPEPNWEPQHAVVKRSAIIDLAIANRMIKEMRCNYIIFVVVLLFF